ncbi:MAG: phosphate ABC transporter permease PstA [Gammaproteobacteria bacterium]|nr:phosphate ABC transporter permease PstA [Gammaproteobacteria bacterium]
MSARTDQSSFRSFMSSGQPWVWMNGGAVAISMIMVAGLLLLIAMRGLGHFWPKTVYEIEYDNGTRMVQIVGERVETEEVPRKRIVESGIKVDGDADMVQRSLIKVGIREVLGVDFMLTVAPNEKSVSVPEDVLVLERTQWGNFYGFLTGVKESGRPVDVAKASLSEEMQSRLHRVKELRERIEEIEKTKIGAINFQLEKLRLKKRGLELKSVTGRKPYAQIEAREEQYTRDYEVLKEELDSLYRAIARDSITARVMTGDEVEIQLANVVKAYRPNAMSLGEKIVFYIKTFWGFVADDPREANTEGGIFPAIFGTVVMVLLMSIIVTPFGVVAAIYLREYARQGLITRLVRISVNNLAGVPSIVYGVFGLGFFVYVVGGTIDELFYREALPSPTFGSGGVLWASLTLALLTVPVVIVATEEGLSRIPRSIREGSLALGATKAETLWRTVLPMASPAMMTGLILAVARAAGEVAPLMLVGAVKLAPSLPIDANAPFVHLERKFMHLGFHIYDVGFQSPNVEAARPLVYATALILVAVIVILNISAIYIRNHLREKYRNLEEH